MRPPPLCAITGILLGDLYLYIPKQAVHTAYAGLCSCHSVTYTQTTSQLHSYCRNLQIPLTHAHTMHTRTTLSVSQKTVVVTFTALTAVFKLLSRRHGIPYLRYKRHLTSVTPVVTRYTPHMCNVICLYRRVSSVTFSKPSSITVLYLPLRCQQQQTVSNSHTYLQQSTNKRHLETSILCVAHCNCAQTDTAHYTTVTHCRACNTWTARLHTAARE